MNLSQQLLFTLTFLLFLAPPHLIEKPQDVQKLIDDSLVWECKATGKPKPSYRWMKNGENLESAEVRCAKRLHVLKIRDKAAPRFDLRQQLCHRCFSHAAEWRKCATKYCIFLKLYCAVRSSVTD